MSQQLKHQGGAWTSSCQGASLNHKGVGDGMGRKGLGVWMPRPRGGWWPRSLQQMGGGGGGGAGMEHTAGMSIWGKGDILGVLTGMGCVRWTHWSPGAGDKGEGACREHKVRGELQGASREGLLGVGGCGGGGWRFHPKKHEAFIFFFNMRLLRRTPGS